jgi:Arc/MetJ-type ribon-helix-helix transcriptional regulator
MSILAAFAGCWLPFDKAARHSVLPQIAVSIKLTLHFMQYSVILRIMRTTKVVSITLPPAMFEEAQALAKQENRTMSELVREALRRYQFNQIIQRTRAQMEAVADETDVHTEEDVVRVIREFRQENAARKRETVQA